MKLLLPVLILLASTAYPPASRALEVDPAAQLMARRLGDAESPACLAVGLVEAGKSRVSFGCTADAGPATFDRDTLFEIGSIAKGLTGLLLADMVRKGEVRLDDPAAKYSRPGAKLPEHGRAITLRDLAAHRASLPRLPPGFAPADWKNPYAGFDADALYAALAKTELQRPVGVGYGYSNFGYMWLSEILARAGGRDFEALLAERVLVPLGMASTRVRLAPAEQARRAVGHDAAYQPAPAWDIAPELAGAGGVWSSIADMLKLAEALAGARRTPLDETIAVALEPLERTGDPASRVAYGWIREDRGPKRLYWHNGGTGGFSSMLAFDREARRAAVVLADSAARFDDLARHLVDPARPLEKPAATAALGRDAQEYAGRYEFTPAFSIEILARGRRLFARATNQPPFALRHQGKDLFDVAGVDAQLRFERGAEGRFDRVELLQSGREQVGRRVP